MADSKKYNGSTWGHSLRKLSTATDTITTLPTDLYADGTNATVGLVGNMYQALGVSPTTPIQPSECGDRTGNLLSYKYLFSADYERQSEYFRYYKLILEPTTQYTLNTNAPVGNDVVTFFFGTADVMSTVNDGVGYNVPKTITSNTDGSVYIAIRYAVGSVPISIVTQSDFDNGTYYIILNSGSTALPYEPYGYKIPISSANTTTPVYLGEVQSTRRIKKLVLTGEENWQPLWGAWSLGLIPSDAFTSSDATTVVCSHYDARKNCPKSAGLPVAYGDKIVCFRDNLSQLLIKDTSYSSVTDFQTYLTQQYNNGTPVTVWYVLAEPETTILNEPIRKIGDYADTVSGISIPTITGKDTFDVQTTLKPSEVSLTYTGWHDASVKEWDGSEWH